MKHRMTISLDEGTLLKIGEFLRDRKFRNKSHLVEMALLDYLDKGGERNAF